MSNLLIAAAALVLFVYWFRYHCLTVLAAKPLRTHVEQVAVANSLSFIEVREILKGTPPPSQLPDLYHALLHDYRILTYLLRNTAAPETGSTLEQGLLRTDFRLMQFYFALTSRIAPARGRRALQESARILEYFAHAMGERAALTR